MRMYDLILKKRNGKELTDAEIQYIVNGYTDGLIPDYQMSALAMAILFKGMTDREIAALTDGKTIVKVIPVPGKLVNIVVR